MGMSKSVYYQGGTLVLREVSAYEKQPAPFRLIKERWRCEGYHYGTVLPYLQERCIDVLQPDCCHTGGISQMKKIATLAETYFVPLAPHCTASYLGIAASLHVVASIPFFLIHEFYPDNHGFNPKGIGRMAWKLRCMRLASRSRQGRRQGT